MITRREFSKVLLTSGTASLAPGGTSPAPESPIPAQPQGTHEVCDLLIKGGTVIDPGQRWHAPMDVAVKDRKILEVSRDIPESRALQVYSAKGKIVTPGFIDLHVHAFNGVATGMKADHYCLGRGVTTVVDCGSTGFPMIGVFIEYVVKPSTIRIYPLVEIGALGTMLFGQIPNFLRCLYNLDWVDPERVAKAAIDNKPAVVGIKIHLDRRISNNSADFEMELLKRALQAAEASHLPLMMHARDTMNPLTAMLKMLRKGDIFTHCFNGFPNNVLDANGKVLPGVRDARERGIFFDIGEDHGNLSFKVADKCLQQDFLPDTISTDQSDLIKDRIAFDLATVASKFLALGMSLDQVIERVTTRSSRIFDYGLQLGTLLPGSEADIGIFEVREGNFEFVDGDGRLEILKRVGHQILTNKAVVCRGQLIVNEL